MAALEKVNQPQQHRAHFRGRAGIDQVADGIDDDHARVEFLDLFVHDREMRLEPVKRGPRGRKSQQVLFGPRLQVQTDGAHVAGDLLRRFLKGKIKAAFAPARSCIHKKGGQARLPGACCSGNQNAAAAIIALAAKHGVQTWNTARNPRARNIVGQTQRRNGQDAEAVLINQEWIFIGAMGRTAIFDNAQPPRGDLLNHTTIEDDDAVRDIFFQSIPRQSAVALFASDDGRDAFFLQPPEQAPQFSAKNGCIAQAGEQALDRVEHHAFCTQCFNGIIEPNENSFEVILAGFLNFVPLNPNVIDKQLFLRDQRVDIKSEGASVFDDVIGDFLKCHQHARFVELGRAAYKELHAKHAFTAARAAADQCWTPFRQTAVGNFIKSINACGRFR